MTTTPQEARQAGPVAAGALNAEPVDPAEGFGPLLELGVTAGVGRNGQVAEASSVMVDRNGDMNVFVSVDTNR
ncbi:MAG: hypothetical protein OSB03_02395 [Vicinamibacterales bacterium]|nr:hypothetical protein [Vicinamibacterales bacterium]